MELIRDDGKDRVAERLFMLKALTGNLKLYKNSPVTASLASDVDLEAIAGMTAGFGEAQLRRLCDVALNGARQRLYDAFFGEAAVQPSQECEADLSELLQVLQKELVGAVEDVLLERDLEMITRKAIQDGFERRFMDIVFSGYLKQARS